MELMDVQKFAPTCKIYDTYVGMNDLALKINGFQQAYARIDFENPNEDALKRAKELQRMAEDYREKLENVHIGLSRSFATCTEDSRCWARSVVRTSPSWTGLID